MADKLDLKQEMISIFQNVLHLYKASKFGTLSIEMRNQPFKKFKVNLKNKLLVNY